MIRPSTQRRDTLILKLYYRRLVPKEIMKHLRLANVWIIYDALRRERRGKRRANEFPKLSQIKP